MTTLNKQARLVSSARISEIANGANLIMGEKEWLANTAIYLANELKTATKAFQSTGFSLLEAEEKLEAADRRNADLEDLLEAEIRLWTQRYDCANSRRESAEKRIAELEAKSAPESFSIIGTNILTQDNRITSDPMFCVYQKREIVVDADYDYDRIVWVDEDGNEANERQRMRLELLHENFREAPEKWRRVALKEIDDFVTCCFTEQGCKDYLACNGHNLRLPFIYVKSGFRNAEFISVRNWLAGIGVKGE